VLGCRKGSRECVYPEPKAESKSVSSSKSKLAQTQSMENLSEVDADDGEGLSEPSEAKPSSLSSSRDPERAKPPAKPRPSRRPSRPEKTRSSTSAESPTKSPGLAAGTNSPAGSLDAAANRRPWGSLSQDQQFYLDYYREKLNYTHYQFKHDADNFFQTTLLDTALQCDPLRYAVVGFAAFHHTVSNPKGKLTTFLTYYNRAVSLLRKSLQAGQSHTEAMLITILQLASFEVSHSMNDPYCPR
jgi:Fungal specific transcription factor domain